MAVGLRKLAGNFDNSDPGMRGGDKPRIRPGEPLVKVSYEWLCWQTCTNALVQPTLRLEITSFQSRKWPM